MLPACTLSGARFKPTPPVALPRCSPPCLLAIWCIVVCLSGPSRARPRGVTAGVVVGFHAEHGSWETLQKSINTAAKGIELWQVGSIVRAMVAADHPLPQPLTTSFARTPSLMRSLWYARRGAEEAPYDLGSLARNGSPSPAHAHGAGQGGGQAAGPGARAVDASSSFKIRVRRESGMAARCAAATQTKHDVSTLSTPQAVLSPAHQTVFAPAAIPHQPAAASACASPLPSPSPSRVPDSMVPELRIERVVEEETGVVDSEPGAVATAALAGQGRLEVSDGHDSITVEYAGGVYLVKLPPVQPVHDRISSVADKVLADHNNELFVKAAIQHESLLPCPVARCQGSQHALRMPQASRAQDQLCHALVARFPFLADDYACPLLRVDLSEDDVSTLRQVYVPPLQDSKGEYLIGGAMSVTDRRTVGMSTTGLDAMLSPRQQGDLQSMAMDAVHDAVEAQGVSVSDGEARIMAERLIEYSGPHSRWRLRSARRQGQGADGDPVGISLTLDQDFDAWVVDPTLPAPANVLSADRDGEFAGKVRAALAALLQIPGDCIQVAGLHRGSIIVDFNLLQPPGDARTPMQLYEQLKLASLVLDPDSPIRADPTLSSTIRVHLRGAPHSLPRPHDAPADAADANAARASAQAASHAAPAPLPPAARPGGQDPLPSGVSFDVCGLFAG